MFELIKSNFSDFVEGQAYFENISSSNSMKVGDEIFIVGGPGFEKSKAEPIHEKYSPSQVDNNGNLYTAFTRTGVTITNMTETKNSYSMSFQTWKGHVEAGTITFTVLQGKGNNISMHISSIARNSNIVTNFAYYNLGGRQAQTNIWRTFL